MALFATKKKTSLMDAARSRQYLKAMGITAWVPRSAEPSQAAETSIAVATTGINPVVPELQPACTQTVSSFLQQISGLFADPHRQGNGSLLVLIEPPVPGAPELDLLGKMLTAIGLDPGAQSIASVATDGDTRVSDFIAAQRPQMVLMMIACGGSPVAIDAYRAEHHRPSGISVPLAFTHHPAQLNNHPEWKRPAWEDLKRVKAVLDG